ncbi:ABC transporter permease [Halobacterium litoreum]|uniref:ABC transporter permease n=1 Tax=Halobacterium litoreum TaxID=2039234 RepID=A0ABD5NF50_9EURY|nr:ABC transporter permease [Halobacterium litoreum]UHH13638.1 ABC transporter permease [Halobacterium litoreum]
MNLGQRPGATVVFAVLAVQLVAFAVCVALGYPTAYAAFALASAAALGYGSARGGFETVAAVLATGLLLVLGLPLALLVANQHPGDLAARALDPAVQRSLYLSVYGPLLAAGLAVGLGVPLAYLLSRGFPGHAVVESLVDLPLVVPHSVAGIAVVYGFGRDGLFPGVSVTETMAGLVLAMAFVSAPFAVNAAREAFEAVDRDAERAARSLGASRWETFKRVTGPLAARGILTGGVLSWARAVSEFGAVAIVAYNVEFFYPPAGDAVTASHAPVLIYRTFTTSGIDGSGAVATLLLALCASVFLAVRTYAYDGEGWP